MGSIHKCYHCEFKGRTFEDVVINAKRQTAQMVISRYCLNCGNLVYGLEKVF